MFPRDYTIIRKDRTIGGGGVFLALSSQIPFLDLTINTSAEMIWGKITPTQGEAIYICSFYRLPNGDDKPIEELKSALAVLGLRNNCSNNMIIAGDFNFPSIVWEDGIGHVESCPTYGRELNNVFLDVVMEFCLEQQVFENTRGNHILDLVLSSEPHTITELTTVPGMSDHEAVIFKILTKLQKCKSVPHKIYQFHKANKEAITIEVQRFTDLFRSVQENWHLFQTNLFRIIENHIPSKVIKPHKNVPWLNRYIKQQMKVRKKLYIHAKRTQNSVDWMEYRQVRNKVNKLMKESHSKYCTHMFDDNYLNNRKRSWSLIKSLKKDYSNIVSLNDKGNCVTTPQDKADVLNKQFYTFFTNERDPIPNLEPCSYPQIGSLQFSINGIYNVLNKLSTNKSAGPDKIPNFILKLCSLDIAPVLCVIFTQSLKNWSLPNDWLSGSIVAIFKKGNRNLPSNYRPISLTSTCCKVMEHIIFHFIMDHLQRHNIINKHQHGFRPAYSCQSHAITITH